MIWMLMNWDKVVLKTLSLNYFVGSTTL